MPFISAVNGSLKIESAQALLEVVGESGYNVVQGDTILFSATSLLENDTADDGKTLSITSVQNPVGGTVTLNGTNIQFVSTGQAGDPASFQYTVSDGVNTATGTVLITVTALSDLEAYMFSLASAVDDARVSSEYIPPTIAEIFNTWARFDGANYYEGDDPNKSSNASAWQLLENPDRVLMPLNVDPTNGFISPDALEFYTFEATLQSISSDNDTNGLIVAFSREGSTNHVLSLAVSKAGSSPRSGYALMYFQNTSGYSDEPVILAQPSFGLDTSGGWSSGQIRLKIQRIGDIIKCYASQFNDTGTYQAGSEIIFDLSTNSNTQRFMGPSPYGYMTFSQPDSSYVDINIGGGLDRETIYDAENNIVWDWNSDSAAWQVLTTDTTQDRIGFERQVTNPNTTERFIVRETTIEYLGKSENAVFDAIKVETQLQNIYINSITGGTGVGSGVDVVGLFEDNIEEKNLLFGTSPLPTTTGSYADGGNTVGNGSYFSDNGIDITNLVNGTVVFANGTVGVITSITQSTIKYTVTTDFTVFDETLDQPSYSLSADSTQVDEGVVVTVTLTTTLISNGTTVAYTITGIDSSDISDSSLTGNFIINSNTGTAQFTIAADATTEGQEVLTLSLDNNRDEIDIIINDTSTIPAGDWSASTLAYTLDNPNAYGTSAGDRFGKSVAISGDRAIVGSGEDDADGDDSGKAYIFDVTTGALVHTLDNPNPIGNSAREFFGNSVAISDSHVIVGAEQEDEQSNASSGKAYIFDVTTGSLVHTLDNPNAYDTSAGDKFGEEVAISGNYAIVGVPNEDDAGGSASGKAYIFDVTTGALVHTLDNPNAYGTGAGDYFGGSVGISGDRAIVSALQEDEAAGDNSGKAYIFNVTTGALVHTLDNPNASTGDRFGTAVDISGDRAIVTAYLESDASGTQSGKAYIYNVTTGALVHTLDDPNAYGTSAYDNFGLAVAISNTHAIVGTYQEDDAGGSSSGKAYIFDVSTGALVKTLDNPNAYGTSADDRFGVSVSISGNNAIVGAVLEDDAGGSAAGKAYIFTASTADASSPSGYIVVGESNAFDSGVNSTQWLTAADSTTGNPQIRMIVNSNVVGSDLDDQVRDALENKYDAGWLFGVNDTEAGVIGVTSAATKTISGNNNIYTFDVDQAPGTTTYIYTTRVYY